MFYNFTLNIYKLGRNRIQIPQQIRDHIMSRSVILQTNNSKEQLMKQTTTQFQFAAKPKVTAVKPKYRQRSDELLEGTNLMNDPRVVRGNTYAAIIANKNQVQPPVPQKKSVKQAVPKKGYKQRKINFDTGFEPTTPRAVDGRDHFTTQTEPFVETLRDKPIQYEKQSQTDLFLDRPVERAFNPMAEKTGVDRTTQVDENDPQLFNFDYEVQPILEALLSKVIQTSRMELHEEEEMTEKQKQKVEYEKRRHTLLAEAQKLQANENRLREEYERRHLQYRKSKQQEVLAEKKVISRILTKQYLRHLQENTEHILDHQGFFRNSLQLDIYERFLPWLYEEIHQELQSQRTFQNMANEIMREAVSDRLKQSQSSINKQMKRRKDINDEKQRKKEEKRAMKEAQIRKKQEQEQEARRKAEEQAKKQQGVQEPAA